MQYISSWKIEIQEFRWQLQILSQCIWLSYFRTASTKRVFEASMHGNPRSDSESMLSVGWVHSHTYLSKLEHKLPTNFARFYEIQNIHLGLSWCLVLGLICNTKVSTRISNTYQLWKCKFSHQPKTICQKKRLFCLPFWSFSS